MQIILSRSQIFQKVQFGYKRFSENQTKARKAKYYESRPDMFKRISKINKKIDFKSDKLRFPINVPLRFRWIYHPAIRQELKQSNYLNFKEMTSNEILLHFENPQFMEISEFVSGFNELQKRDSNNEHDLVNHPWVQGSFEHVRKNQMYLKQEDVIRLMMTYYRLGVKDPQEWEMFHKLIKERFLNKISPRGFGVIFILAFKDNGIRFPEEFRQKVKINKKRQELALLLPIHLRQLQGQHIGPAMRFIHDSKLMTNHLWERHFHQILWKRPFWLAQYGSLPYMLSVLVEMNYGDDEFMYPELYKSMHSHVEQIPYQHLESLERGLEDFFVAFPHHSIYKIGELIKKLEERKNWENSLGQQAKKLSLVQIVQNDLEFYKEKLKLESTQ